MSPLPRVVWIERNSVVRSDGNDEQSGVDLLLFDGSFSDLDSECIIDVCTALQWCFPARDLG